MKKKPVRGEKEKKYLRNMAFVGPGHCPCAWFLFLERERKKHENDQKKEDLQERMGYTTY